MAGKFHAVAILICVCQFQNFNPANGSTIPRSKRAAIPDENSAQVQKGLESVDGPMQHDLSAGEAERTRRDVKQEFRDLIRDRVGNITDQIDVDVLKDHRNEIRKNISSEIFKIFGSAPKSFEKRSDMAARADFGLDQVGNFIRLIRDLSGLASFSPRSDPEPQNFLEKFNMGEQVMRKVRDTTMNMLPQITAMYDNFKGGLKYILEDNHLGGFSGKEGKHRKRRENQNEFDILGAYQAFRNRLKELFQKSDGLLVNSLGLPNILEKIRNVMGRFSLSKKQPLERRRRDMNDEHLKFTNGGKMLQGIYEMTKDAITPILRLARSATDKSDTNDKPVTEVKPIGNNAVQVITSGFADLLKKIQSALGQNDPSDKDGVKVFGVGNEDAETAPDAKTAETPSA